MIPPQISENTLTKAMIKVFSITPLTELEKKKKMKITSPIYDQYPVNEITAATNSTVKPTVYIFKLSLTLGIFSRSLKDS